MTIESDACGQLRSLSREVATLTAALQREKQRRSAIAAHAKDQEALAAEAVKKLRAVQYANKRLEEEVAKLKEAQEVAPPATACPGLKDQQRQQAEEDLFKERLKQEILSLRGDLSRAQARGHALEQAAAAAERQQHESSTRESSGVDAALAELQAIVPQYKAAISAQQSRVAVLGKQLEAADAAKVDAVKEAVRWRETAQRFESSFAAAAARVHSQEAAALEAAAAARNRVSELEGEAAAWRRRCETVEEERDAAVDAAQRAQHDVTAQTKLVATQSNTIARLEGTVREQQEDIMAALDLVCSSHPTRPQQQHLPDSAAAAPGFSSNSAFGEKLGGAGAGGVEREKEWTIPAAGAATAVGKAVDELLDPLEAWLSESPAKGEAAAGGVKEAAEEHLAAAKRAAAAVAAKNRGREMAALAADIVALKDALKAVL